MALSLWKLNIHDHAVNGGKAKERILSRWVATGKMLILYMFPGQVLFPKTKMKLGIDRDLCEWFLKH